MKDAAASIVALGRQVMRIESLAIERTAERLGLEFARAVDLLHRCDGRVILTGVGKSGHIAKKIAATLASTGTPSFFVHPAEAGHGDLGMVVAGDVVIGISNSGESDEVVSFVSFSKKIGTASIGISGSESSRLAQLCDVHLDASIDREACPLGIAPTASTAVQLALGDALAMATLSQRGFTAQDFAARHPLGALGRRFFVRVKDVMQPVEKVPHCELGTSLLEAIAEISNSRVGALIVTDEDRLAGIFTDSDLRRLITQYQKQFSILLDKPVSSFTTKNPATIQTEALATEALRMFDAKRISRIVCMEGDKLVGLLSLHDLINERIA